MSRLYVPVIINGDVSLFDVECNEHEDGLLINGNSPDEEDDSEAENLAPLTKKIEAFLKESCKHIKAQIWLSTKKKSIEIQIGSSTQSITLGVLVELYQYLNHASYKEDWASITITGDVSPCEGFMSLSPVDSVPAKFEGVKYHAEQHPEGRHLFIYVTDEELFNQADVQREYPNITIRHFPSGSKLEDVFLYLFSFAEGQVLSVGKDAVILDECQRRLLDGIDVNRNGGFHATARHEELRRAMNASGWKGYVFVGEGERGKSATAAYLAKCLTVVRQVYAPLWVRLDNETLRDVFARMKKSRLRNISRRKPGEENIFSGYFMEEITGLFPEKMRDKGFAALIRDRQFVLVLDNLEQDILDDLLDALKTFFSECNWHPYLLITSRCSAESVARKAEWQDRGVSFQESPVLDRAKIQEMVQDIAVRQHLEARLQCPQTELDAFFRLLANRLAEFPGLIIIAAGLLYKHTVPEVTKKILSLGTKENEEKFADLYAAAFELLGETDRKVLFASIGPADKEYGKTGTKDIRDIIECVQEHDAELSVDEIENSLSILVRLGLLYSVPRPGTTIYGMKSPALVFFLFNDSIISSGDAELRRKYVSLMLRLCFAGVYRQAIAIFKKLFAEYDAFGPYFSDAFMRGMLSYILVQLIRNGHDWDLIQLFINRGACIDDEEIDDGEHSPFINALLYSSSEKVVKGLISAGVDIHVKMPDGACMLHYAAMNEHIGILEYVLTLGFDVNSEDDFGNTPLLCAAGYNSNVEVLKRLIAAGADTNHRRHVDGGSLLHFAAQNMRPEIIEYVLTLGFDVDMMDAEGATPLFWAVVENHNVEVIKRLVAAGADIHMYEAGDNGFSLIGPASSSKNKAVCAYLKDELGLS